ncbi:MAG TPA: FG-GAP-like repeat-containing protein [Gammaproteobacteria bacterium]|nr:FG-GAP-like repeat-containing protein [Gammaproteobacteria bacterium]
MNHVRRALLPLILLAGILALVGSDAATSTFTNTQFSFTQGAAYPTGAAPAGVAVGDLNGDGVPDIVTADSASKTMSVLIGKTDGTYQPRTVYPVGQNPSDVALVDLDHDGHLDAIVTNNDDNTVTIWWGKGDGTFGPSTLLATASGPHRIVTGDIDGDGNIDIAIVDWTGTAATIFYGDGKRHFTTQTLGSWGAPDSIAIGDLNGDGKPDIVIGGERETVWVNQGNRQFKQAGNFQPGFHSDSIFIADINHDGKGDVIAASQHEPVMTILYGNGDGTLDDNTNDIIAYGLSGAATDMKLIDLNKDGSLDAVVSYGTSGTLSVLMGTADGHFLARQDSTVTTGVNRIATTSFGNGNVDLVGVSSSTGAVFLFYGNPGIALGAPVTYPVGNSPAGLAIGDLNGDGSPDIVTVNGADNTMSVLLGSVNGTFGSRTDFSVGINSVPRRVQLADVDGDKRLDAIVVDSGTNSVLVLQGTGTGIFGAQASYNAGTSPTDLVVTNLKTGETVPDIAVAAPGSDSVVTLINSGTGTFPTGSTIPVNGTPFAIAAGDFEDSGVSDLAVTEATGNKVAVLHDDGSGNLTIKAEYPVGAAPQALVVADFNGAKYADNKPILDIAVANFNDSTVSVLMNDGKGNFTLANTVKIAGKGSTITNQAPSVQPMAITAADMNGDGIPDLITTNNEGSLSVLIGDGKGDFLSQSTLVDASGPAETQAVDLNADGRVDLATVDKTLSVVAVRLTSSTNIPVALDVTLALDVKNSSFLTGSLSATSPTGGTLTYQLLSQPANGTVTLVDATAGTFKYTPNNNFTGIDTFTYEALNNGLASNQATVSVTVSNSGSGAYSWLLVAVLGAFAAYRLLAARRRGLAA